MNTPSDCCDYCSETSDSIRVLLGGPFPPSLCPSCYAIASDGPQGEPDTNPSYKPLTPLENWQRNDEHNVS